MPKGVNNSYAKIGDKCKYCGCLLWKGNILYKNFRANIRPCCYSCYKGRQKDRTYADNKGSIRRYELRVKYGITLEEFNKMRSDQENKCAICNKECDVLNNLSVDHNKRTGKSRELLCYHCNIALGHLYEDETIILNMLEYIRKHNKKSI